MKKTIVITGGTGGIGYAAAIAFAKQGHEIIFQGRDAEKGKIISGELSKWSGAPAQFIAADLSSIDGIKTFAATVKTLTDRIAALIHSTGTFNSERRETKDGFYESFAVNYLCKFILDKLLLDELKQGEGHVIIVGGPLMKNAAINFDDLQMKNSYSLMKSRGQNQLAVHMHAQEFAKRNPAIPINVINPGLVKTGIDRNVKGFMKFLMTFLVPFIGNSAEEAVVNIVGIAETDRKDSGYYYPKVAKPGTKEKIDLDATVASRLWDLSIKLGKLS